MNEHRFRILKAHAVSLAVLLAAAVSTGCGDNPVAPPPPPPAPAAAVSAVGGGALVLHPSIRPEYAVALETPLRISETAGGSADWGYARMSLLRRGVEIERSEFTATNIQGTGCARIAARSDRICTAVLRFNTNDFDNLQLTLGFSDVKDGRLFTVEVPFESFADVTLDFTPLSLPRSPDRL